MIADFQASAKAPGAMERDVVLPFATLPAQVALDVAKFDLLVHGWDLASATGQTFDPPADVVAKAHATAEMIVGGARDGDTFKDAVDAPAGASPIDEPRGLLRSARLRHDEGARPVSRPGPR